MVFALTGLDASHATRGTDAVRQVAYWLAALIAGT
jgi:hypothetical protein